MVSRRILHERCVSVPELKLDILAATTRQLETNHCTLTAVEPLDKDYLVRTTFLVINAVGTKENSAACGCAGNMLTVTAEMIHTGRCRQCDDHSASVVCGH